MCIEKFKKKTSGKETSSPILGENRLKGVRAGAGDDFKKGIRVTLGQGRGLYGGEYR